MKMSKYRGKIAIRSVKFLLEDIFQIYIKQIRIPKYTVNLAKHLALDIRFVLSQCVLIILITVRYRHRRLISFILNPFL